MTDAALSVTQDAVERFTEQYLVAVGCNLVKDGNHWEVTIPMDADTDIATGEIQLVCSPDPEERTSGEPLHPESTFFQSLLTEASERWPTGRVSLTAAETEITLPPWVVQSDVSVERANVTPYYDRTAIMALFQVSVETVSEYQTDLLHAVAADTRSGESLPGLAATVLSRTRPTPNTAEHESMQLGVTTVRQLVDQLRNEVVAEVEPKVEEIHESASRAADAEVEEYRQLKEQRIEELAEEEATIARRIEELNTSIEEGESQSDRAEALKQRKVLKSEMEEVEAELRDLRQRRERGFPTKQREIRNRHALEVVIEPVTVTEVGYEQGELDLEVTDQVTTHTVTVGYGCGIGVTEDVTCSSCSSLLSESNPLQLVDGELRCSACNEK